MSEMRKTGVVLAGVLLFGVGVGIGGVLMQQRPEPVTAQNSPAPTTGRYQIVNGTPQYAKNIMLLDSLTGESWVVCEGTGGETTWCKITRSEASGVSKPSK